MACMKKAVMIELLKDGGSIREDNLLNIRDVLDKNGRFRGSARYDTIFNLWKAGTFKRVKAPERTTVYIYTINENGAGAACE